MLPLLAILLLLVASIGFLLGLTATRWRRRTAALARALTTHATAHRRFEIAELAGLPDPVRRYFLFALTPGQAVIRTTEIETQGTFNASDTSERWQPFVARQWIAADPPGFVWDARIRMLRLLSVRVHDAYVGGEGILRAEVGGFPVAGERGTVEIARGELLRYLAEAPWHPTSLLPGRGVAWEPIDEVSARATLTDGEVRASLVFRFDAQGAIESMRAEDRGRMMNGTTTPAPWEGRWFAYETRDGMRVPGEGEVAWVLPEGRRPYWRGRVTRVRYEFE